MSKPAHLLDTASQQTRSATVTTAALTLDDCAVVQVALDILVSKLASRQKAASRRRDAALAQKLIQRAEAIGLLRQKLVHIQARAARYDQVLAVAEWIGDVSYE